GAAGVTASRTSPLPPGWRVALADGGGLEVLVDVPWRRPLFFLDSAAARREARQAVRDAATRGGRHGCLLAYSVGNEVPPDVIRWHGARRVGRFLAALAGVPHRAAPAGPAASSPYA